MKLEWRHKHVKAWEKGLGKVAAIFVCDSSRGGTGYSGSLWI